MQAVCVCIRGLRAVCSFGRRLRAGEGNGHYGTGVIGKQHGGIRPFQLQALPDIDKADVLPVSRSGWVMVKILYQLRGKSATIITYREDHPILLYEGMNLNDQGLIGLQSMLENIFHKGLDRQDRDLEVLQLRINTAVESDLIRIADLLQGQIII